MTDAGSESRQDAGATKWQRVSRKQILRPPRRTQDDNLGERRRGQQASTVVLRAPRERATERIGVDWARGRAGCVFEFASI